MMVGSMFGQNTYLVLELVWALPVIVLQIAVGWRELWAHRNAWIGTTAVSTLYLCLADRLAIGDGIWHIAPNRSTGVFLFGLPIEEAVFFLLTNLLVVQAMLLFMSASMRARANSRFRRIISSLGLRPTTGDSMRAGYRRGLLGAVGGALLTSVAGAVLVAPTALEPVAQAVMQWTPVAVANMLLQLLGPSSAPLALLGALAIFMGVGGALGTIDGLGRSSGVIWVQIGVRGFAWAGLAVITWWSAGESDALTAVAQAVGIGTAMAMSGGAAVNGPAATILWRRALQSREATAEPWARTDARGPSGRDDLPGQAAGRMWPRRGSLLHTAAIAGGAAGVVGIAFADMAARDRASATTAGVPMVPFVPPQPRVPGFPVDGQLPEVTPVAQFYVVSKNAQDPRPDPGTWRLRIGGLVARPFTMTFDDVRGLPRRDEYVTFQCVSNPVGGSLMSAAWWSGASLADLIDRATPLPSAARVVMRALDGHEESVAIDVARRPEALVAYAMNGDYLTRLHGHPARALLPGHYGFKQVKWLTHIDLAPDDHRGYWPRRGWTDEAAIRTTARIDLVRPEAGGLRVAGVALAGRRGISSVEVRVVPSADPSPGGSRASESANSSQQLSVSPWTAAELHAPVLSSMMWVQWRVWLPGVGASADLSVEARATDGTNTPQESTASPPYPNGSSGYHRVEATSWSRAPRA
jgi:lycopene cyclase domain-containing protein